MTAPEKVGQRRKRRTRARLLALAVGSLIVAGLTLFVGPASAAPCDTDCNVIAPAGDYSWRVPSTTTVTVTTEIPTTITNYLTTTEYATEYVPTTVTDTTTSTEFVPTTVTIPTTETTTVPTTVTSLVPTTERVTVTGNADPDGVVTATENVTENVTERVTETENVIQTQQTTERATTTVDVTRWNATAVNTQTGKTPAVTTTASQVSPGGVLTLSGDGYTPGEPIQFVLHSDPVLLETVNADANGQFQTAITIPVDTPVGEHTINVVGVTCGIETVVPLTVVAPTAADHSADPVNALWSSAGTRTLSYTGVNAGTAGTVAALLIGTGVVLLVATRRRTGTAATVPGSGRHRG